MRIAAKAASAITLHGVVGLFAILHVSMRQHQSLDFGHLSLQRNQVVRKQLILNHVRLMNCRNAQEGFQIDASQMALSSNQRASTVDAGQSESKLMASI